MAQRRMISRSLGMSERFAAIQRATNGLADFCQALYPLVIVNADDFGRMQGDAFTVKHTVLPTSPHPVEDFDEALTVLHRVGLIIRYEVDAHAFLEVVDFEKHQQGLHKRTKSTFPPCPQFLAQSALDSLSTQIREKSKDFTFPELPGSSGRFPLNRIEQNRREEKDRVQSTGGTNQRSHATHSTDRLGSVSLSPASEHDIIPTRVVDSFTNKTTMSVMSNPDLTEEALRLRAGALLEHYAELFTKHCYGAKYHNRMHLDFAKALGLVRTWPDDARLEKLAILILTTDDEWITGTDRGFAVFAAKASWADKNLAAWEADHGLKGH